MAFFSPPARIPAILKWWYPSWYIWDKKEESKTLYLSFDDGPVPEVTPWVLELLDRYNAKASFFCIGDNIHKHPDVFKSLLAKGHRIGNHTLNHLKGWETPLEIYLENTQQAQLLINASAKKETTKLFRPPYGKIKRNQAKRLRELGYDIIMYRVIAYDWDAAISKEQCLHNVLHHTKDGDIVVFHDSIKAYEKLKYVLPKVLEHFSQKGYRFGLL